MATENDKEVEDERIQSATAISISPTTPANNNKVFMFGKKSGFVIPKNKLSGSLVPIFRGGGKAEAKDVSKEETAKQVQRKTKWGADLTQDASVRKGRALAYQIRVEQIIKQLKFQDLEVGDDQGSHSQNQNMNSNSSADHKHNEVKTVELLELEKREIVGEILRLNPSYKPPADYKPLLKEAKVPVPVKAYPGYNFLELLLGPESKTKKRLEEETGAKIRVLGTKPDTSEKYEITSSDVTEAQDVYDELHVTVSADTYEKVDAAVALIELLLTPVAGNATVPSANSVPPLAGSNMNVGDRTQPVQVLAQTGGLHFQQYRGSLYPVAPPANVPFTSVPNNTLQFSSPTGSGLNHPPMHGHPTFGSFPGPSTAAMPSAPIPGMQQPPSQTGISQSPSVAVQLTPQNYPALAARQLAPIGTLPAVNPSPFPMTPQPTSTPIVGPVSSRPMTAQGATRNNPGWPQSAQVVPPTQQMGMTQMAPPLLSPRPPTALAIVPATPGNAPNIPGRPPAANFAPQANFAIFQTSSFNGAVSRPVPNTGRQPLGPINFPTSVPVRPIPQPTAFPSTPNPSLGPFPLRSVNSAVASTFVSPAPGPLATPSQVTMSSMQPTTLIPTSSSSVPNFLSVKPSTANPIAPPRLHASSSNFTFQPLGGQVSPSTPVSQNVAQGISPAPTSAPQMPFRPGLPQLAHVIGSQGFARPPVMNLNAPAPMPFSGNSGIVGPAASRPVSFPNPHHAVNMVPPSSFSRVCLGPELAANMALRPDNMMPQQIGMAARPFTPAVNQLYGPYSPSSISSNPVQKGVGHSKARSSETDSEYDDLMTSMGVR